MANIAVVIAFLCGFFVTCNAQDMPFIGRDSEGHLHINSTTGTKVFVNGEEFVSASQMDSLKATYEARFNALERNNNGGAMGGEVEGRWVGYPIWYGDITLNTDTSAQQLSFWSGVTHIYGNFWMTSISIIPVAFENLTFVGGFLEIRSCNALTNVDGLSALTSVGGVLSIDNNVKLLYVDGLSALTSVGGDLNIYKNYALTNVDGLSALTSVGGVLNIYDDSALTNVDGLNALTSVGGYLRMRNNDALTNVDGLSALTSVGGVLSIYSNNALTNVDGLGALTSVGGTYVMVCNNDKLSLIPQFIKALGTGKTSNSNNQCPGNTCTC